MAECMLEKMEIADVDVMLQEAKAGNPDAMYQTGHAYQFAEVGDRPDYEEAFRWYEKAAKMGHVEAMISMGDALMVGRGCKMDRVTASSWYQEAYEIGCHTNP